jgi:hypothetical protein
MISRLPQIWFKGIKPFWCVFVIFTLVNEISWVVKGAAYEARILMAKNENNLQDIKLSRNFASLIDTLQTCLII